MAFQKTRQTAKGLRVNTKPEVVKPVVIELRMRFGPPPHDRLPQLGQCPPENRRGAHLAILASSLLGLFSACCCLAAEADSAEQPSAAEALLKTLDPFYKQHVVADGLLIVGSEKVCPCALREVAYLARKMLANRPDLLQQLVKRKRYVCVMAYNEMQTDLPECRCLEPRWDYRARGETAGPAAPARVRSGQGAHLPLAGGGYRGLPPSRSRKGRETRASQVTAFEREKNKCAFEA